MGRLSTAIQRQVGVVPDNDFWRDVVSDVPESARREWRLARSSGVVFQDIVYSKIALPIPPRIVPSHSIVLLLGVSGEAVLHHATSARSYSTVSLLPRTLAIIDPARLHWAHGAGDHMICVQWDVSRATWYDEIDEMAEWMGAER